jgi:hypothetical protein
MKVLFWFRKSEAKSQTSLADPHGSIQLRITLDNIELEIGSTSITCKKSQWDATNQILIGSVKNTRNANQKLNQISNTICRIFDILSTKYEYVSTELVKEYYLSKKKFTYTIREISKAFFKHRAEQVQRKIITQSTYDVNENYERHILDYCEKRKVLRPTQTSNTFFTDIFNFLIDDHRTGERVARKVACFAKQVLKWGKQKGMNPALSCFDEPLPGKAESEDFLDTTHLSIKQIEKLYLFNFYDLVTQSKITEQTAETLSRERHAFIFNCFTGMHHCDYTKKEFLVESFYGALFLRGKRQKTDVRFSIKLLEPAVEILKLYNNQLGQLPVKSNQKRNDTLKLVAMYAEIPLKLTTKVARKTFCDLALNEMLMSTDDVAACLGLKNTKYLKNYGRIRERRLMKTMGSWGELKMAS